MPSDTRPESRGSAEGSEAWPAKLVGGRLREARRGRSLTLDDVAGAAGFTKSFVSAVERGETSPSIGSLHRICDVLGITMSALFETDGTPETNVVRRADVHGTYFGGEGVVNYVLSPRGERRGQVIETHIAPGGSPGPEFWSHPGDLVVATVLEGSVEFRFNDRSAVLKAGDTIAYSPAEPHSWGNPDDAVAATALLLQIPAKY
jgi:transcriptional regulator with XRE-family HTH domain